MGVQKHFLFHLTIGGVLGILVRVLAKKMFRLVKTEFTDPFFRIFSSLTILPLVENQGIFLVELWKKCSSKVLTRKFFIFQVSRRLTNVK